MYGVRQERLDHRSPPHQAMKAGLSGSGAYGSSSLTSHDEEQSAAPLRNRRWRLAGYGLFAAILFIGFLIADFPYADTVSDLIAPLGMKLVYQRQAMNFPIGARLEDVRLLSSANDQLLLQSPELTVAPRLGWLFRGRPSLRIHARLYGGMLNADVSRSAGAIMVDFELDALKLAQLIPGAGEQTVPSQADDNENGAAPNRRDVSLSGELSGRGSAQVAVPDIIASRASVMLSGRHVKAMIVNGLPPLDLEVIRARILLAQDVATLQGVRADGSDGELEMNGRIELAPDVTRSIMHLTISLTPTPKGQASFGFLMQMLPHAPSAGPYHVEGILTAPSIS
jgi:type II secretion system protein N